MSTDDNPLMGAIFQANTSGEIRRRVSGLADQSDDHQDCATKQHTQHHPAHPADERSKGAVPEPSDRRADGNGPG